MTELLARWQAGSTHAEEELMARVYGELRRIAARYLRRERQGHTLAPTAVVHEVYLRLVPQRKVEWENSAHFFRIAARMTRRVLVDHARKRRAAKRDGVTTTPITISNVPDRSQPPGDVDVLALHEALSALANLDARQAEIIELRYFGGLTVEEVAQALGISPATVKREWTTGRVWLRHRLRAGEPKSRPAARLQGR